MQGSGGARAGRTPNGGDTGFDVWNCQVKYLLFVLAAFVSIYGTPLAFLENLDTP